jgi:ribosomal protein S18 acetylase RimI-like enzyme
MERKFRPFYAQEQEITSFNSQFKLPGYQLRQGSNYEKSLLVNFLIATYQEFFPEQQDFSHLSQTVEQYFLKDTPLIWVEKGVLPVACLWMGNAIDQVTGDRYSHIFLLYVKPEYRKQGIGTALMKYAENWAKERGDRQLGLQVFTNNQAAFNLYQRLGYIPQSYLMIKSIKEHK